MAPDITWSDPECCRLKLDVEKKCFVYQEASSSYVECDGIVQAQLGIDPSLHQLNSFPFLPISLPTKSKDQKVTYRASCRKCLLEKKKSLCKHEMKDRRWTDVYNLKELAYAVCDLKYTLFRIEEGLVYTNLQPIFQEFMRMMASKKIRHATVPSSYKEDLETYCSDLNKAMGFTDPQDVLTPDCLEETPYLCAFEKGVMNMCVGKMAQSPIQTTVEFVSDDERLTQIFCDKSLEIDSCFPISNGWDQVAYHKKDSFLRSNRKANMCVNATVTSLSRIYIDKALRKLQENGAELIYSDTDSVIFSIDKDAKVDIPYHPTQFLSFASEIPEDEEIQVVCCMGAKNYSYETRNIVTKEPVRRVTKVRGLTLRGEAKDKMDINKMLHFVEKLQQNEKAFEGIPQVRIQINAVTKTLSPKEVVKMYTNFSNKKRYYMGEGTNFWPYGTTSYT